MSEFIYHRVEPKLKGTILYPLNQLKDIYPDMYAEHVKKYEGREHLLETQIPILNCLWNDVLHFTAVSPHKLLNNLRKGGLKDTTIVWNKWFKIPIELIDKDKTIVCLYRRDINVIPDARDFSTFDPTKMEEYRNVPPETIEYYKEQFGLGRRPLTFHRVPHILYKGTIETKGLEIITIG
jgi:hypothetical protein